MDARKKRLSLVAILVRESAFFGLHNRNLVPGNRGPDYELPECQQVKPSRPPS